MLSGEEEGKRRAGVGICGATIGFAFMGFSDKGDLERNWRAWGGSDGWLFKAFLGSSLMFSIEFCWKNFFSFYTLFLSCFRSWFWSIHSSPSCS